MKQLDKFEYLDDKEVWPTLIDGEKVYAVVMWSARWKNEIYNLRDWTVGAILDLFREGEQVIFLKEVKK